MSWTSTRKRRTKTCLLLFRLPRASLGADLVESCAFVLLNPPIEDYFGTINHTNMPHKIFLAFLITFSFTTFSFAQTLKVTAVEASDDKNYNQASKNSLGKAMILNVYDNSISVKVANNAAAMILKQTSPDHYKRIEKDDSNESEVYTLTINKTLSVITSAELTITIKEKGGQYRQMWVTITGKRF
jgi:hypothetical protein